MKHMKHASETLAKTPKNTRKTMGPTTVATTPTPHYMLMLKMKPEWPSIH
jgi:hypothetical protein